MGDENGRRWAGAAPPGLALFSPAAPLHPSTRGACRGPRFWRFRAWQKRASASTRNPRIAETTFDLSKIQLGIALSHAFLARNLPERSYHEAFRGKSRGPQSPALRLRKMMAHRDCLRQ